MNFIGAFHSELVKVKHTPFWAIHFCMPLIGAILFTIYYIFYKNTEDYKKLKLILELTATVFPLLISAVVSLNVMLEEKSSHFQTLLAVPNRYKILLTKLAVLYSVGVLALFWLFFFFLFGIYLFGIVGKVPLQALLQGAAAIAFSNLIIYILHLFLSLKFGFGISLFWGVFESLQCILYSNIELGSIGHYIPFAWSINCVQDIINNRFAAYAAKWISIVVLTIGILLLTLIWFFYWEGRKNYE